MYRIGDSPGVPVGQAISVHVAELSDSHLLQLRETGYVANYGQLHSQLDIIDLVLLMKDVYFSFK